MALFKEFREFAVKGNVIDLAVGVIIGAAFGKIVTSLVEDVIMPPISLAIGKVNFSNLYMVLPGQSDSLAKVKGPQTLESLKAAGVAVFAYGNLLNQVIQFLIVAFSVFLMVKALTKAKTQFDNPVPAAPSAPTTKECPFCLSEVPIKATRCKFCTSEGI